MKPEDLKCPWGCKGAFELRRHRRPARYYWYIWHLCKFSHGCFEGQLFKTEQGAIKNWNSWITPTQRK